MSPNRKNVKLGVEKVTNDTSKSFSWLCEEFLMKRMSCSRTLVYVRDYNSCGQIYGYFMRALGDKAYWPTNASKISCNRIIAMYHSGTVAKIKQKVISSLKDPQGKVRLIIATSALGMGVDIKGLYRVINYGPPPDIESYVQAFGRAGRDGEQSEALLMYHGHQLRLCTPVMLDYLKAETCRRLKILALFGDTNIGTNGVVPKHLCCDICAKDCECDDKVCHNNNGCMVSLMSKATTSDPKPNGPKRDVSESQRKQLEALLKDCQDKIREEIEQSNLHCLFTSIDHLTCFSNSLIQGVITKCEQLYSLDNILESICVWNVDHASQIFECLKIVFEDVQEEEEEG